MARMMAAIKKFEDLDIWQSARGLTRVIYEITSRNEFAHEFSLKDQMQRAAVSILSNISEGFERDSNKEFLTFLSYAKGSCGELRSQLYVALDQHLVDENEFKRIYEKAIELSKMLSSFMSYLRHCGIKGNKYK